MSAAPAVSEGSAIRVIAGGRLQSPAPVIRTEAHTMAAGVGLRSVRRRIPPQAGFALEALGHAIEYLADEYAHQMGHPLPASPGAVAGLQADPQVAAIQILMAANREVYYACPVIVPFWRRLFGRRASQ